MAAELFTSIDWIWLYLIPFMLVITVIVFVHELGHYLVAKYNGVKIEVFSIGFGPEIFGFNDKAGTRWKFSWIPLGGYVRMLSDADAASRPDKEQIGKMTSEEMQHSHFHKTVWQRIQISVAGPLANFAFSIIVFTILFSTSGQPLPPTGSEEAFIGQVSPSGPAGKAGIKAGDKVISVNDVQIHNFKDLQQIVNNNPGKNLAFEVLRPNGAHDKLNIMTEGLTAKDEAGNQKIIGIINIRPKIDFVVLPIHEAALMAVVKTYEICAETLKGVGRMITGKASADSLSGPIGIAKMSGELATADISVIFTFIAILSLSLGLINLFPIPMLDGGHLLFYLIEAIKGKPLTEKSQEIGFTIGLVFLGALMLFSTWNDLGKLQWVKKLISIF